MEGSATTKEPEKEPEIRLALNQQEKYIHTLNEAVERLENRINDILRPDQPREKAEKGNVTVASQSTAIGQIISGHNESIVNITQKIDNLNRRCEV